jgi:hypothetical protein
MGKMEIFPRLKLKNINFFGRKVESKFQEYTEKERTMHQIKRKGTQSSLPLAFFSSVAAFVVPETSCLCGFS